MKQTLTLLGSMACCANAFAESPATAVPDPIYAEYREWRVLGQSHRLDAQSLRSILGNPVAINAARGGKTQPWPDGSILANLAWKQKAHPRWPQAIVPGEFGGADAMIKDSQHYAATGGWGFGHWEGQHIVMESQEKAATCFACHAAAKDSDFVFTEPALR